VTEHVGRKDRRRSLDRARHGSGTAGATGVEQDRPQRLANGSECRTHRGQVCGIHNQDLEDRPTRDPLQVGFRRLCLGLVAAGQMDGVDVGAQRQLPRHVFAEPGVGAGDEERVVRQGFQLTASTAARMSGTSLRVV
jgi:hypothetical protein